MTGLARAGAVMITLSGPATAQERVSVEPARYVVRQWDTRSGLPQNTINDVAQTSDGYLWLATFGGLVRFDGVRFQVFTSKSDSGIGGDRAVSLAADRAGRLWAGTEAGLVRLDGGRFTTFTTRHGLPDNAVLSVYADASGAVWVMTENGLARYVEAAGRFAGVGPISGIPRQLAEDDRGTLWLRTDDGMFRRDEATDQFVSDARPTAGSRAVSLVGRDRRGGLWIKTLAGLVRWHAGTAMPRPYRPGLDSSVSRIAETSDGALWVASSMAGVTRLPPFGAGSVAERQALPAGATDYYARVLFIDTEGQVWGGTNVEGLLAFRRRVFTMLPLVQRGEVSSTAILGDRMGRVWIGANCDLVNVFERGRLRVFRSNGVGVSCVWAAAVDHQGGVWLGTWGDYLYHYVGGRLRHVGPEAGLNHGVVLALHADTGGILWVGTQRGGLNRMRAGGATVIDTLDGLPSNQVLAIVPARGGGLWVATTGGLARLRGDSVRAFTTRDGLSSNNVRAVLEDRDGTVWIGTYGGGITRLRAGVFRAITTGEGLVDDAVSAIVDDGRGHLWVSGNSGISRLSRAELNAVADGRAASVHAIGYGVEDGLETEETNGGFQPAAWRAPDGRIWFPTIRGVAVLDPEAATSNPVAPRVFIERLVVDGRRVPLEDAVHLPRGSGNVEIEYTALSSPAPEAVAFRYRLEGADGTWVNAGGRRIAYYTRLRPGRYAFTVLAANRDGVWSDSSATLALVIAPPIVGTWWFRLLAAVLLLTIPAAAVLLRMSHRARVAELAFARRLIDSQEQERKRIASELHDSIGQDLLVMKNRAELALRAAPPDADVREQLQQISHVASDALRQTRGIAHKLRPAQLDRLGLSAAVRSAVEQAASASGIAMSVETGAVDGLLSADAEIGVFRIVQEGVNNILKHAGASSAAVGLVRDNGVVRVLIRDNGVGFQRAALRAAGIGISGIAERVKLMGGSLQVESAPGAGVTLTVTIPIQLQRHGE